MILWRTNIVNPVSQKISNLEGEQQQKIQYFALTLDSHLSKTFHIFWIIELKTLYKSKTHAIFLD